MSSVEEVGWEDSGEALPISFAEVTVVFLKLYSGKAQGMDEIGPEMLKSLDITGLPLVWHLLGVVWRLGAVPLDWQKEVVVALLFLKRGQGVLHMECLPVMFMFK